MFVVLIGIVFAAVLADLAEAKIPNALIIFGLVEGLFVSFYTKGPPGLAIAFIDLLASFACFYILFYIRALGAGDVKLLIVVSTFLGINKSIKILFIAMILGGLCGIIKILFFRIKKSSLNSTNERRAVTSYIQKIKIKYFDLILKNILIFRPNLGKIIMNFVNQRGKVQFTKIRFSPFILAAVIIIWKGYV